MKDITIHTSLGTMNTEFTPNTDAGRDFCAGVFGAGTVGGSVSPWAVNVYVRRAVKAGLTIGTN